MREEQDGGKDGTRMRIEMVIWEPVRKAWNRSLLLQLSEETSPADILSVD